MESSRDLNLVQKIFVSDVVIGFWNFQSDARLVNGVGGFVDNGQRPGRDSTEDAIFSQFLPSSKQ
jgi:hypothetical protein